MTAVVCCRCSLWIKFLDLRGSVCAKTWEASPVGLREYAQVLAYHECREFRDKVRTSVALYHFSTSPEASPGIPYSPNEPNSGTSFHEDRVNLTN